MKNFTEIHDKNIQNAIDYIHYYCVDTEERYEAEGYLIHDEKIINPDKGINVSLNKIKELRRYMCDSQILEVADIIFSSEQGDNIGLKFKSLRLKD